MARSRNIKPGLFMNEILGVSDPIYSLLFIGLWTMADRDGRLEDRPLRIKASLFPYKDGINLEASLLWLESHGFIIRYGETDRFIQIVNFAKHQNPHKNEVESIIPKFNGLNKKPAKIGTSTDKIGSAPADSFNLIPDSLNTDSLIPSSLIPEIKAFAASPPAKAAAEKKEKAQSKTGETWNAYSYAYIKRYRCEPVRNAKINGQLAQLVDRLGAKDAPPVAAYFISHNSSYYIQRGHAVDALVHDCEKLRTEWATGNTITQTKARQMDKTASNVFLQLLQESQNENK